MHLKLLAWTLDWSRLVETSSSTAHVTLLASSVILEEAGPVCFWENVVAQVDPLFVVKKAGSSSMHEPAVFGTPFGPMLSVKSLCDI